MSAALTGTEVADRLAIADTVARYFYAIDHREFELFSEVFAADVEAVYEGVHIAGGRQLVMDFCMGRSEHRFPLEIVDIEQSMHFIGNHVVTLHGDTARAETYCIAHLIDRPPDGRRMRSRGLRYVDELARQPGGEWLITKREHILDWMRLDAVL